MRYFRQNRAPDAHCAAYAPQAGGCAPTKAGGYFPQDVAQGSGLFIRRDGAHSVARFFAMPSQSDNLHMRALL